MENLTGSVFAAEFIAKYGGRLLWVILHGTIIAVMLITDTSLCRGLQSSARE